MACHDVASGISRHSRAPDDQRHVDIFLVGAFFAGRQPVLSDMVAVVGAVDDEGIIEDAGGGEPSSNVGDQLVDRLQCAETLAVEVVIQSYGCLGLLGERPDPGRSLGLESRQDRLLLPVS